MAQSLRDALEAARDAARALSHEVAPGTPATLPSIPHHPYDVPPNAFAIPTRLILNIYRIRS